MYLASVPLTLCLILIGCSSAPDTFPPPLQRQLPPSPERKAPSLFVHMDDEDAANYIVRDIQPGVEGSGWRWTHEFPELRFVLDRTSGLKFAMDFSFPGNSISSRPARLRFRSS